jgi:hypothetical protein
MIQSCVDVVLMVFIIIDITTGWETLMFKVVSKVNQIQKHESSDNLAKCVYVNEEIV